MHARVSVTQLVFDAQMRDVLEAFRQVLLSRLRGRTDHHDGGAWADGSTTGSPASRPSWWGLKVDVIVAVAAPAIRAAKKTRRRSHSSWRLSSIRGHRTRRHSRATGGTSLLSRRLPIWWQNKTGNAQGVSFRGFPGGLRSGILRNSRHRSTDARGGDRGQRPGTTASRVRRAATAQLESAFAAMSRQARTRCIVIADVVFNEQRGRIAQLAAKERLPPCYGLPEHVEAAVSWPIARAV